MRGDVRMTAEMTSACSLVPQHTGDDCHASTTRPFRPLVPPACGGTQGGEPCTGDRKPSPCHCEEPRGGDVAIPSRSLESSQPCAAPSCAARLRGLLRRFGDSLLAMTTERMSLVCLLDAVPKVCELMHKAERLSDDVARIPSRGGIIFELPSPITYRECARVLPGSIANVTRGPGFWRLHRR